ncbi:hypothetical protein cypCar_00017424 [Cyprinus carpio]|nr:hypothetical protein cypCar_00017424 [Cyprinus carpio]
MLILCMFCHNITFTTQVLISPLLYSPVCQGTNNKLTLLAQPDDHYRAMVRMYSNCTVVLENLEITNVQEYHDLSFLRSIEEVEILKGGVKIAHNPLLCNVETIQWLDIVQDDSDVNVSGGTDPQCRRCDSGCFNGSCWAPGPENCQTFTRLNCAEQCSRRCKGPKPIDCCSEHCAAGCTGPRPTDCLGLFFCSRLQRFRMMGRARMRVTSYALYDPNTHHLSHLKGSITLDHLCEEMALPYLAEQFFFSGFLLIQDWPEHLNSLSPFENLEIIRGRTKQHGTVSFAALNIPHLDHLGLRSLKEISDGDVVIKNNPRLCYVEGSYWPKLFRSVNQRIRTGNNAAMDSCEQQNSTCDSMCGEEGCWGPGPSMCVSCQHVSRRGRCVSHCNLLDGDPREYMSENVCLECDPECKILNGTPSCHGPVNTTTNFKIFVIVGAADQDWKVVNLKEYINQDVTTTSNMINPNYEGPARGQTENGYIDTYNCKPDGPEYLNTSCATLPRSPNANLDNPDYQHNFLPSSNTDVLFLPATENLHYLGLSTAMQSHVR